MKQPSLFVSHGTVVEALRNESLKADFAEIRRVYLPVEPSAIVVFSGHWQTKTLAVTTHSTMHAMDEGFPAEFHLDYSVSGNIELSMRMVERLHKAGISAETNPLRGLDHGAVIPLRLLFPERKVPVVQISQQWNLNPVFHKGVAEVLNPLREENVLFIGSGGVVHNLAEIERFGGHRTLPDDWAREFDAFVSSVLSDDSNPNYTDQLIQAYTHPGFARSHPTSEHYLPLVFASAFGGTPVKVYEAFQWKNLSMSAFFFD